MKNPVVAFLEFVDKRRIVRRAHTVVLLWMLVDCYRWATGFVESTDRPGAELALVLAVVTWPITTLVGIVYRMYDTSRRAEGAPS